MNCVLPQMRVSSAGRASLRAFRPVGRRVLSNHAGNLRYNSKNEHMNEWRPLRRTYALLVARSWNDGGIRERILRQPKELLLEEGIAIPEDMQVEIIEGDGTIEWLPGSPSTLKLPLPSRPDGQRIDKLAEGADIEIALCISPCSSCCCG